MARPQMGTLRGGDRHCKWSHCSCAPLTRPETVAGRDSQAGSGLARPGRPGGLPGRICPPTPEDNRLSPDVENQVAP
jgi:hypothetical protein